jgi:hypothetical protein
VKLKSRSERLQEEEEGEGEGEEEEKKNSPPAGVQTPNRPHHNTVTTPTTLLPLQMCPCTHH